MYLVYTVITKIKNCKLNKKERDIMNKTQYEEMNDLLLVEKENKILEAKKLYKEIRILEVTFYY